MFGEGTADASGRIRGEEQRRDMKAQRNSKTKHLLINKQKSVCYPCYMCMCTHAYIHAGKGCRDRKQTTGKGTSGKWRGTDITGIVIIRMHFCVTEVIFFLNTPQMRKIKLIEFHGIVLIDN